jgi:hypothetical protein
MKTLRITLATCALAFSAMTANAQNITCDIFSITGLEPDTFDVNNTLINIQMAGTEMDFINYPFIPAVWDCNGDTVASGYMFFFGQIGSTTQGYPVSALAADVCLPLTVQFVYSIGDFVSENDTCLLTFSSIDVPSQSTWFDELSAYPNPTQDDIQLSSPSSLVGKPYELYDAVGRVVLTGRYMEAKPRMKLADLKPGIYLLHIGSETKRTIRLIKE